MIAPSASPIRCTLLSELCDVGATKFHSKMGRENVLNLPARQTYMRCRLLHRTWNITFFISPSPSHVFERGG